MGDKLRVGLVGAHAGGRSWSSVAHIPAIRAVPDLELAAVCTTREASARAAAKAFDIERHYSEVGKLVQDASIDLIAVVVKVPGHFDAVMAALHAGKHVYCEWPLGVDLAQARAMAARAQERGVVGAVGLQGRHDPHLKFVKELYDSGWFGELLSVDMSMSMRGPRRSERGPGVPGASLFAIAGGHTLDAVMNAFGDMASLTAQVGIAGASNDKHTVPEGGLNEAADYVAVAGRFANGAFLTAQLSSVPDHHTGWRMTVHGTEATLQASTSMLPQISPITLRGARVGHDLATLSPPDLQNQLLPGAEGGPPRNIAIAYAHLVKAIRAGTRFRADFNDAVAVHTLLCRIQEASDRGQAVQLGAPA